MDIRDLKAYVEKSEHLTLKISKSILKAIEQETDELPEEGLDELGDCILNASYDITSTILSIMAEYDDEDEYPF